MPTYDYLCAENGQVIEVKHRMSETYSTWGEICSQAGIEPGATPLESPVRRLATGGQVIRKSSLGSGAAPACASGSCCAGGMCGLDG